MDKQLKKGINIAIALLTIIALLVIVVSIFLNIYQKYDISLLFTVIGVVLLISSITLSVVLIIVQREVVENPEFEHTKVLNEDN